MKLREYLREKAIFITMNLFIFMFISTLYIVFEGSLLVVFIMACFWFLPLFIYMIMEYIKFNKYFNEITGVLSGINKKYLLTDVVKKPDYLQGQIVHDTLREISKEMQEEINIYKNMQQEYREYIETWIHEIKTPIASIMLIIDNNENAVTKGISREIKIVEDYIEQVLYYTKSNNLNQDYIIKKISLEGLVRRLIRRNSSDFINKKIHIDINSLDVFIYSDEKWVEFILNQIIGNAIKYSESGGTVSIYAAAQKTSVTLTVEDEGVGISEKDINRVFEKGFTGENGRKFGKSTGIGLYLCKKLCENMGLGINIESKVDVGTKISIVFPLDTWKVI